MLLRRRTYGLSGSGFCRRNHNIVVLNASRICRAFTYLLHNRPRGLHLNRKKDTEDALPAQSGPDRLTEKTAMAGAKADDKTAAIIAAAVTTYLGQDRNFVIKKIERNGKSRS